MTLEKPVRIQGGVNRDETREMTADSCIIGFASPEDAEGVEMLAGCCFSYSRFHLDPEIPGAKANEVKARWAGNFFLEKRGDFMVVARKGGAVIGFLQLLRREDTLIIDLIGVDADRRRTGVGTMLIAYAEKHCGVFETIRVGTQMANISSLRFYERHGFMATAASYVFHFHGKSR